MDKPIVNLTGSISPSLTPTTIAEYDVCTYSDKVSNCNVVSPIERYHDSYITQTLKQHRPSRELPRVLRRYRFWSRRSKHQLQNQNNDFSNANTRTMTKSTFNVRTLSKISQLSELVTSAAI